MELNDPVDPRAPFEDTDDVDGLDLTPRDAPTPVTRRAGGRRVAVLAVLGLLGVAAIVIAYQGLSNATLFFRNADEAVAERDDLGTKRFRMQGVVLEGVEEVGFEVRFEVEHGGVVVPVHHVGDPPELFQPGIPVVLEGRWSADGSFFESDRILVKHSSEYEADNPDRVDDYVGEEEGRT